MQFLTYSSQTSFPDLCGKAHILCLVLCLQVLLPIAILLSPSKIHFHQRIHYQAQNTHSYVSLIPEMSIFTILPLPFFTYSVHNHRCNTKTLPPPAVPMEKGLMAADRDSIGPFPSWMQQSNCKETTDITAKDHTIIQCALQNTKPGKS